ncbi:MAG TPA: ABC transporter permease [Solirubrobacteraceae bacterium]|jgi:ribose/xylose/arabinose/galactoside ABC-type transport system permease subunit|nr:ABC transporter permease [Solirubrobacteraceae bacterium]
MSSTETAVNPATDGHEDTARAADSRWPAWITSKSFQGAISFIAFIAIFVVFSVWLGSKFFNVPARYLDIHQSAPVLLLGLSVLVTLIAGQFDLSVASMATLTTFLAIGLKVNQNWPFALVIVVCMLIGVVGGLVNGFLVVRLRVNTFIATLGTGGVFLGLSSVYSKGAQLSPTTTSHQIPHWFSGAGSLGSFGEKVPAALAWLVLAGCAVALGVALARRRPPGVAERTWQALSATAVIVLAVVLVVVVDIGEVVEQISLTMGVLFVVALAMWVLLNYTTYGRYLHATGSNATAARLAGVKPDKETTKAFVLGGVLAAFAGIILAANQGSAAPEAATGFLLPAFAAAFLSTVILSTGRFTVWGTLIGGTFLVWVGQGLVVGGLAFTWTAVVNGVVLILAVALSTMFRRTN